MITAKQVIEICEDYAGLMKIFNDSVPFYKNPTRSDFVDMVKSAKNHDRGSKKLEEIRVIADANTQDVYVADGYWSCHEDLCKTLNLPTRDSDAPWVLHGYALWKEGNVVFDANLLKEVWPIKDKSPKTKKWLTEVFNYNWSFVDKYIKGTSSAIKNFQEIYEK